MYKDFVRALAKREDLSTVYDRLRNIEFRRNNLFLEQINRDMRDAEMIAQGLREDPDSYAYRMAVEFLRDAEAAEDQKAEELKTFEAARQQLEEEYLQSMRKGILRNEIKKRMGDV